MRIMVGTASGLLAVEGDRVTTVDARPVRAASGGWTVHDDTIVDLASGRERTVGDLTLHCVLDTGAGALAGTSEAHVLRVDGDGLTVDDAFDAIPSRDDWYTPWGAPPDTRSIAASASSARVLVNVHVGGVWLGEDGSWTEVVDVDSDTHQVLTDPRGSDVVVVAAAVGFGLSCDGGRTFRWTDAGLHASYCRAVAIAGDHVLLTASTGPRTREGAVYRRPVDGEGPFERVTNGLPDRFPFNIDTFQLAAADEVAAVGTETGQLFVSEDAGRTWELAATGLPDVRCVAVDVAASSGG